MPGRRTFLLSSLALAAETTLGRRLAAQQPSGEAETALPAWEPGVLEIHHIATGRGNSALVIGPDASTLLIDAGEAHSAEQAMSPARPDASLRAGEWIARYVKRQLGRVGQDSAQGSLGTMLLTHLHGDHLGEVAASSPQSRFGNYKLTGAADVAEVLKIDAVVDRGWPGYNYPAPPRDATALNYIALARSLSSRGTRVEKAKPGSTDQLALRVHPERYPAFQARVLAANGEVWSGAGDATRSLFPPVAQLTGEAVPSENMCSIALRIGYGKFRYFTGGDLTCDTTYGLYPWHDVESAAAQAAGPVSVAVADHHGYFDACGPAAVRALQPRVWIIPTWHASHPDLSTLANFFSTDLYAGERSVYALDMTPAAMLTNDRFVNRLASTDGHVVIRVAADGETFTVYVIDDRDERGTVKAKLGPLPA